jgi:hypothetical protein
MYSIYKVLHLFFLLIHWLVGYFFLVDAAEAAAVAVAGAAAGSTTNTSNKSSDIAGELSI